MAASRWFTADQIAASRAYHRPLRRLVAAGSVVTVVALLVLWRSRLIPNVVSAVGGPWPVGVVVATTTLGVVLAVVWVPATLLRYRHERAHGKVAKSIGREIFGTLGVSTVLTSFLIGLACVPLFALIRTSSTWWWQAALATAIVAAAVAPVFPFMLGRGTQLRPLSDEGLRQRLTRFCRDAGLPVPRVGVIEARGRPDANAVYLTGVGGQRTIVLDDTVLDEPPTVVEFLLAQALGHARRHDVVRHATVSSLPLVPAFLLGELTLDSDRVQSFAGLGGPGDPAAVSVLVPLVFAVFAVGERVARWNLRRAKLRADLEALDLTRDPDAAVEALRWSALINRMELEPGPWATVHSTRPPVERRLEQVERWRASRHVALLFTDIVDSTATVQRLGDHRWFELLRDHDEIVRAAVAERHGVVVEHTGDGFLVEFADPGQAVLCAVDIQRRLEDRGLNELAVRMGAHAGEIIRHGGNVHGREVHLAARVSAAAGPGEILVSDDVRHHLEGNVRFEFAGTRAVELKGFEGTHELHSVHWRADRSPDLARV